MDYTIIGNAVNLTARLQSHSEIDGILLGHETYSLVKDEVSAEEQTPIKVKGFAEPVRCHKVVGLYDHLAEAGTVIREEHEGFKFHLNLKKRDKAEAISILEASSRASRLNSYGARRYDAPMAPNRKLIGFDPETLQALELLSRDSGKDLQDLADEAFTDLLAKHHRPRSFKDALKRSARREPANENCPPKRRGS